MRKLSCSLFVLAACGGDPEPPPPTSSWGVPITGGTMTVTADGALAVIGDPDRDRVVAIDIAGHAVAWNVPLTGNDEPGRIVEDAAGRIHVALRRGGAIATLDRATGAITDRRAVCAEPRGLAYRASDDALIVACTDGQLVWFGAAGGAATARVQLDRDLRDVVVRADQLVVTRFRTAEILTLDAGGAVVSRAVPPTVQRQDFDFDTGEAPIVDATAAVAWRTIGLPDGRVLVSHQRKLAKTLGTGEGQTDGYGGGCGGGPVEDAITVMQPGQPPFAVRPAVNGALPVDVAVTSSGDRVAFAIASQQAVQVVPSSGLATPDSDPCPVPDGVSVVVVDRLGAPTSVAYTPDNTLLVYYPEAPALAIHPDLTSEVFIVAVPGDLGYDAGREMFHAATGVNLACASCHPEGRDDGQVWEFDQLGPRRTQSVAGNILARAPYHWNGDQSDLSALVTEVFEARMAGGPTTPAQKTALGRWLDRIPAPAPIAGDPAAIARGQAIFESNEVGCAQCHNGALYTNNTRVDVGTGDLFKVPSLRGVAARAPYLHDGCAATLLDRLTGACGGGDSHGHTSQLTAPELADLVVYLESL